MRVLIVGSTGQVGGRLMEHARLDPAIRDVHGTTRTNSDPMGGADLRDEAALLRVLDAFQPSHVILAAAATNVAWCEAHPEEARAINVDGTGILVEACRRVGAHLTFFSTDYVFDGTAGPYAEFAATHPINVYGQQKLEAEAIVLGGDPGNLVVRSCQVFGPNAGRRNYVLRTADQLRVGHTVVAASDLFGTPTFAADLAAAVLALIHGDASGVWHVAGDRHLSRFDLARMVAAAFGVSEANVIEGSAAAQDDGVRRPRISGLKTIRRDVERPPLTPLDNALAMLALEDSTP